MGSIAQVRAGQARPGKHTAENMSNGGGPVHFQPNNTTAALASERQAPFPSSSRPPSILACSAVLPAPSAAAPPAPPLRVHAPPLPPSATEAAAAVPGPVLPPPGPACRCLLLPGALGGLLADDPSTLRLHLRRVPAAAAAEGAEGPARTAAAARRRRCRRAARGRWLKLGPGQSIPWPAQAQRRGSTQAPGASQPAMTMRARVGICCVGRSPVEHTPMMPGRQPAIRSTVCNQVLGEWEAVPTERQASAGGCPRHCAALMLQACQASTIVNITW